MIELKVEDYCHSCPEFEPYVEKQTTTFDYSFIHEERTDTTIYCVHKDRCRCIHDILQKEKQK